MKKYKNIIAVFIVLISMNKAQAQSRINSSNTNAWFMYFGDHKISKHWGIHLEGQMRKNDFVNQWQQLLLRTGINYHINEQIFATVGYCFVETYPYGDFPVKSSFPEHRFWEQIQIKNQISQFEWTSRFRLEQRFSALPILNTNSNIYEPGDAVYTNRFRLLNRVSIPFIGKKIVDKSFYISFYDELFINFGKNVGLNLFDQNRAYAAIGYKIPKIGRLEIGYLEQTILKSDGFKIENNHTIQIGLSSNVDFFKKHKAVNNGQ
ncbi:MAG: DUF2490 domain-containing protein [Phycisphaerales bacterium]|nr:DUF2490 domain-containing protein [Phycisphaerales bacterium]